VISRWAPRLYGVVAGRLYESYPNLLALLPDPAAWQVALDTARAIERVPELLGLSPHLIATARRSPNE
jgi:hypothetical protein